MAKNIKQVSAKTSGEEFVLEKEETKEPNKYTLVFFNDDFTTQEFVVHVLMNFCHKNATDAHQLMLQVHREGKAQVGIFPFDVAQTKVALIISYSRQSGMPLLVKAEKVS